MNVTRLRRRSWRWALLIFVATAMCALSMIAVLRYTGKIRPSRLMYCNDFGYHSRGQILSGWAPDYRFYDESGRDGWVDFADNAVLVITFAADEFSPEPWIRPGVDSTEIDFVVTDRVVTVTRKQDVLVLIRRDGRIREFPIENNSAKQMYEASVFRDNKVCKSLIDSARAIVREEDHRDMDSFLAVEN